MRELLPYEDSDFHNCIPLKLILATPDDNDNGYFLLTDLKYIDSGKKYKIICIFFRDFQKN